MQNREKKFNNRNRNQKQQRSKFEPVTFKKSFDAFDAGLNEVRSIDEYINCIFVDYEDQERIDPITTTEEAKKAIVKDLLENIPEFNNADTKFQALNISSNKVSYKLSTGVSFGWKSTFNKEDSVTTYEFTITALTYSELKYLRETFETMAGWEPVEKK